MSKHGAILRPRSTTMFYGGGLLVLALDIYTIYLVITGGGDEGKKILWILLILLLPLLGPILYLLLGRGSPA